MSKKLFILDVSGIIFRAYFAIPPMKNRKGEATHALFGFIRTVLKLLKDFKPYHLVAVFDGPDNKRTRQEIYEAYKANRIRETEDLPAQIEEARNFCALAGIDSIEIPGVEADDAMGSIAIFAAKKGFDVIICTSDKDLCQLVSPHIFLLNPWKENLIIDEAKVEEIHGVLPKQIVDLLALTGDTSDNIPGVKGIGPKTAVSLLSQFKTLDSLLANLDQLTGKKRELLEANVEDAKLSQKLATIQIDLPFPHKEPLFAIAPLDLAKLKDFYLSHGFNSLVRELDAIATSTTAEEEVTAFKEDYHLLSTPQEIDAFFKKIADKKQVTFFIVPTVQKPLIGKIVGIGFAFEENEAYYLPLNGEISREQLLGRLKPILEDSFHLISGHNLKLTMHFLENEGISIAALDFDTLIASYLLNSGTRKHTVDELSLNYFGKVKTSLKSLVGTGKKEISMQEIPLSKAGTYACEEADYTLRLKNKLSSEITSRALHNLFYDLEMPLTRVLQKMERIGIYVDASKLAQLSTQLRLEGEKLENEIYFLAGKQFNINSPKQLSTILFDHLNIKPLKKTATGLSTSADVLEILAENNPIAKKIIDYRTLEKLRSTYTDTLPLEINPQTKRIHPTFNQSVTATGRLSCQDPNLQNIPVRSIQGRKIREAFQPQYDDWSFLAADYSQIELRLLAHLSQDPKLISAFEKGEDIHAFTASLVFGVPLEHVSKSQRHQAKAINFGIIYGQQAFGLAQEIGVDVKEAAAFIQAYFERYPLVLHYVKKCIDQTKKTGKAVTMIGRERDIPEIYSSNNTLRSAAERLAINTPLQGSAADLIKLAMLSIEEKLSKSNLQAKMILQIHDELIFEFPDEEKEALEAIVKNTMENVFTLKIPLVVDLKVGKNWGEC